MKRVRKQLALHNGFEFLLSCRGWSHGTKGLHELQVTCRGPGETKMSVVRDVQTRQQQRLNLLKNLETTSIEQRLLKTVSFSTRFNFENRDTLDDKVPACERGLPSSAFHWYDSKGNPTAQITFSCDGIKGHGGWNFSGLELARKDSSQRTASFGSANALLNGTRGCSKPFLHRHPQWNIKHQFTFCFAHIKKKKQWRN